MTKNVIFTAITNELEGSAFFPEKNTPPLSPTPQPVPASEPIQEAKPASVISPSVEPKPRYPNGRTPQRLNARMATALLPELRFEIYEDQIDSLRKLSYQEKMEGKLGSMSGMVREAIDMYLLKRTTGK